MQINGSFVNQDAKYFHKGQILCLPVVAGTDGCVGDDFSEILDVVILGEVITAVVWVLAFSTVLLGLDLPTGVVVDNICTGLEVPETPVVIKLSVVLFVPASVVVWTLDLSSVVFSVDSSNVVVSVVSFSELVVEAGKTVEEWLATLGLDFVDTGGAVVVDAINLPVVTMK